MNEFLHDSRFSGLEPFQTKLWLSSPTMHGEERRWVDEAIDTNWVSTVGANIDVVEREIAALVGVRHAVALSCGTSALHLATKLAAERLYGRARSNAYIAGGAPDVGADLFARGLCLPSDNKMTPEQQDLVIEIVRRCFR